MATVSKDIWVGIDDQKIKLEGEALKSYLAQAELDSEESKRIKAEEEARIAKREAILAKLGLTIDEAALLLG
jgi:hypothetical protein